MNTIIESSYTNQESILVDLYDREEFIENILKVLNAVSKKQSSCIFALNGEWGTGKTFVLNMDHSQGSRHKLKIVGKRNFMII